MTAQVEAGAGRLRPVHWALVDQMVVSGFNFLTNVVMARSLDAQAVAHFSLALLGVTAVGTLHRAWLTQPLNMLGVNETDAELLLRYRNLSRLNWLVLPVAAIFMAVLASFFFPEWGMLAGAVAYLAGFLLQEMPRRFHYTRQRIHLSVGLDLLAYGGQAAAAVGLVAWGQRDPALWMLCMTVPFLAAYLVGQMQVGRPARSARLVQASAPAPSAPDWRHHAREHWQFARWVVAGLVVTLVCAQVYPFQLSRYATAELVAAYVAANTLMNALNVLRMTLGNYLPNQMASVMAASGLAGLRQYTGRLLVGCLVLTLLGVGVTALLGDWVIRLLYGSRYPQAGELLVWMAMMHLLALSSLIGAVVLQVQAHARGIFWANLVAAAIVLTAGPWLVSRHGLDGVLVSLGIGLVLPAMLQWGYLYRVAPEFFKSGMPAAKGRRTT